MESYKQIDIGKAKEIIERGDVTIVDIRDPQDYRESHIPRAVSVDEETIQSFIEKTDKNKPLICYCYHGISSQGAANYFKEQGFKDVYSIIGGFEMWRHTNPTVNQ